MHVKFAQKSSLLDVVDPEGRALYAVTRTGNIRRTRPLKKRTRDAVVERDGACVKCRSGGPFEVDHIIRYRDGGPNTMENLRTLCVPCHRDRSRTNGTH